MRIAIFWRALSETPTHQALLRHLASQYGHTILWCAEGGVQLSSPIQGVQRQPVRACAGWHPAIRFLRGWEKPLASFQPEVLLGFEEPYSLQASLLLRWARKRAVPFAFLSCQNIERPLPFPFERLERWALKHSQGAWFLNTDAEIRCRKRGFRGEGWVIPLGAEHAPEPVANHAPRADGFTVGFVGRLVREKGVEDLIRACAKVKARLVVIGAGPEEARLRALAQELGIQARWRGAIRAEEIMSHYTEMDVLVLPSKTTPTWKEQFGRVLVEAMMMGVPVLGSTSGEIPNVIGGAGWTFPEGKVEELAAQLARLRDSCDLRADLAIQGRDRAMRLYTWERVAESVHRLLATLANRTPSFPQKA
jgi:glycosyltransferase involved in cell wall biosynthesis